MAKRCRALATRQTENHVKEYPKDPIGQAAMVKAMLPLVQLIKDEHQRPLFLDIMAKEIGVDRTYLSEQLVQKYAQNQKSHTTNSFVNKATNQEFRAGQVLDRRNIHQDSLGKSQYNSTESKSSKKKLKEDLGGLM